MSIYKTPNAQQNLDAYYDQQLAALNIPYSTHRVNTRHGETHVVCAGSSGAPIFLWHGMILNAVSWHAQIKILAPHFRVYAVDMIGSAGKSAPNRPDQRGTAYGDWATDVMVGLGVEQAHHAGISFGAWIILKLAQSAPERITSAVLMSAAGFVRPAFNLKILPILLSMAFDPTEKFAPKFLKHMSPPGRTPGEEELKMFINAFGNVKNDQVPAPLPDAILRSLTAPTVLLIGEYEKAFPAPVVIERVKQLALPNVQVEVVPGVGHGMTDENPELVSQKIVEWVRSNLGK